jgi:hypothetical protein
MSLAGVRTCSSQLAEAGEEALGDALQLCHRPRQHGIGRRAGIERAEHRLAQQQDLGEQFRAWLIDVAMDQVLQAAGFTLQQRQDLVGFPHPANVVPGRTQNPGAAPDQAGEHQHYCGVQCRNRKNSPADRNGADQPDDTGTARCGQVRTLCSEVRARCGKVRLWFSSFILL